jgi:hypothetical protein
MVLRPKATLDNAANQRALFGQVAVVLPVSTMPLQSRMSSLPSNLPPSVVIYVIDNNGDGRARSHVTKCRWLRSPVIIAPSPAPPTPVL